ncbi:MAG: hypothetical protein AAB263_05720 [Planctomycetota bacterium]
MQSAALPLAIILACSFLGTLSAEERKELSQYGITWEFDKPVTCGQFITGDWWVIGPVTIVKITPLPGPLEKDENNTIRKGTWGDTSLKQDIRMRNGSMIVLACGEHHGYDSRSSTFEPTLSLALPITLEVNRSLISSISNTKLPVDNFCKKLMWTKEQVSQVVMQSAAVLTCLGAVPPADAFRPAYVGAEKNLYQEKDLKWNLLPRLAPVDSVPAWEDYERYFQRPWLEHVSNWSQQELNPNQNQPNYGREHTRLTSIASLLLELDVANEKKRKLLIGLVQYGIDLSGCAKNGGVWNMGGGHSSGRKWPIIFASLMLGDPKIYELPETALFSEDTQTYYGKGAYGQSAMWQMITHHGPRDPFEEKMPEQWAKWDKSSESYRHLNLGVWPGTALAARHMKAVKLWGHDAFFDNVERWMRVDDPYKEARKGNERPKAETTIMDNFVYDMWKKHRANAPTQEASEKNWMWVWKDGKGVLVPNAP